MNAQNLRTLLRKSNNKLSIFMNLEILNQYNCDGQEIFNLIKEFLTDEEKVRLFCCPHFQRYESEIIECILDKNINSIGKKCASKEEKIEMLATLDVQTLVIFSSSNKEKDISLYEIVRLLDSKKQMQFVLMLDNMNLTVSEKKKF